MKTTAATDKECEYGLSFSHQRNNFHKYFYGLLLSPFIVKPVFFLFVSSLASLISKGNPCGI